MRYYYHGPIIWGTIWLITRLKNTILSAFLYIGETQLVRIQVKTGRLAKDESCFEFNTVSITTNGKGSNHRKRGYMGKAEYFSVYVPDIAKVYMIAVNDAPQTGSKTLRFKKAGVICSNGRQSWPVSYEEAIISGVKYNWAEDYEI